MNQEFDKKVLKYFEITKKAYAIAVNAPVNDKEKTKLILEMVGNYISDAEHFYDKGDKVLAFAALNYAHGWLDAGATLKFFEVSDNQLFTVDGE